jgi:hypothetical protein
LQPINGDCVKPDPTTVNIVPPDEACTVRGITSATIGGFSYTNSKFVVDTSPDSPVTPTRSVPGACGGTTHSIRLVDNTCDSPGLDPNMQTLLPGKKCSPTMVMTLPPKLDPVLGNNTLTTASSASYDMNICPDRLTEERDTSISTAISPTRPEGVMHCTKSLPTNVPGTLLASNTHLKLCVSMK